LSLKALLRTIFSIVFFYSGRDASHPEIRFFGYTVIIPAALQETVGDVRIEPGTAALQSGSVVHPVAP
jgi:hypothetical protein